MSSYPKGSEWRIWDLHFHTKASYDCKYEASPEEIVKCFVENNIAVVAITDHHCIDIPLYDAVSKLAGEHGITVLPAIEFLAETRGREPIHFIGIFSEKSNITHIWGQLENCTKLKDIRGKQLNHNQVYCDFDETMDLIHALGGVVSVHSGTKHGSIENIKIDPPHCLTQKTDLAKKVDIFEIGAVKNIEGYEKKVFPALGQKKPLILCSDNHDIRNYVVKEKMWIKADPTFLGLKQAILEPSRVYIGKKPLSLERRDENRLQYIESLRIDWAQPYAGDLGQWFKDIHLEINPELVAIIGNKGSGKTALAEIISYLCNVHCDKDFVFLNKDKFRKKNLAENFCASLTWRAGTISEKNSLNEAIDANNVELVHFVPQNSFEKLCNDNESEFERELNAVVFSRIPHTERLGCASFDDLVEKQRVVLKQNKTKIKSDIYELNKRIKELESLFNIKIKNELDNKLKNINAEIKELEKIRPLEINTPVGSSSLSYIELNDTYICVKKNIDEKELKIEKSNININSISTIIGMFEAFESYIHSFKESIAVELSPHNLLFDDIFKYSINYESIKNKLKNYKDVLNSDESLISDKKNATGEYIALRNEIKDLLEHFVRESDEQLHNYNNYIEKKEKWELRNSSLKLEKEKLQEKIAYIGDTTNDTPSDLKRDLLHYRQLRIKKSLEIFHIICDEKLVYDNAKKPIERFMSTQKLYKVDKNFSITTGIVLSDNFSNTFVTSYINQAVTSVFRGKEGQEKIDSFMEKTDFTVEASLVEFLNFFQNSLDTGGGYFYHNLFKKGKYDEFMDKLYSLDFLDVRYALQMDNKQISELSPGERGSLLLIFYLLLDDREIPLILDQPEDNLDNESIANVLIPFIRQAKKRRQVIMVTHNANLAVVADAEQIIRVKIDKSQDNMFTFESGSLESKLVEDVVNVLEGTEHSFNMRKYKYTL